MATYICFKGEQTVSLIVEPALKHRTSDPGLQPLKTEAHMHSHDAQPSCASTARVWSPVSATLLPQRANNDIHCRRGCFPLLPGDQLGWRAVHRRQRRIRNGYQKSVFVSNCQELSTVPTGKKHPHCSTSSGPQTCGQYLPNSSKRIGPRLGPTFSP